MGTGKRVLPTTTTTTTATTATATTTTATTTTATTTTTTTVTVTTVLLLLPLYTTHGNGHDENTTNNDTEYSRGQAVWYTMLWAVVMWHWRHETLGAPGEMNVAQVRQMDFIYNQGDVPGSGKWFGNNYLVFFMGLVAVKFGLK